MVAFCTFTLWPRHQASKTSGTAAVDATPAFTAQPPKIHPKSLAELLALSPDQLEKVDIALMNLLCAEGLRGSEDLDAQQCLDTLDV